MQLQSPPPVALAARVSLPPIDPSLPPPYPSPAPPPLSQSRSAAREDGHNGHGISINPNTLISLFVVAIGLCALLSLTLGCIVCHMRGTIDGQNDQLEKDRLLHDLVDDILHGRANLPAEHPAAAAAIAAVAAQQVERGAPAAVASQMREQVHDIGNADMAECETPLHRTTLEAVRQLPDLGRCGGKQDVCLVPNSAFAMPFCQHSNASASRPPPPSEVGWYTFDMEPQAQLDEAHRATWFSNNGLQNISGTGRGSRAGDPLGDIAVISLFPP